MGILDELKYGAGSAEAMFARAKFSEVRFSRAECAGATFAVVRWSWVLLS